MKTIKKIILSSFVLFVFLTNFSSLNSHIIYIMGSTAKASDGKKIYGELKKKTGHENIDYFMKSKSENGRNRSNTSAIAFDQTLLMNPEFVTGQWTGLSTLIKENYTKRNTTSDLVIFGDIASLLTNTISSLLNDETSTYKDAIRKIIQLIPANESLEFPKSQSIADILGSIDSNSSEEENLIEGKAEEMEKDSDSIMTDNIQEILSKTITIKISKSKTIFEVVKKFGRKLIRQNESNINLFVANQIFEELNRQK